MSQFTKKAIIDSFVKLLNKTSLDKITVKDIVDDCGVNRNTFYYYFQDIYALLDELFREETKKVIDEEKIYDSWQEGFIQSTKFAFENKVAIYHIYSSINREKLEEYLFNVSNKMMVGFVRKDAVGLDASDEDIQLIASFYIFALVGMALDWIKHGMKEEPDVVVSRIGILFEGSIKSALKNSSKSIIKH